MCVQLIETGESSLREREKNFGAFGVTLISEFWAPLISGKIGAEACLEVDFEVFADINDTVEEAIANFLDPALKESFEVFLNIDVCVK